MMKNWKAQVSIGLVVMVLAFLIAVQFKSVTKNYEAMQQTSIRTEELQADLKKEREKSDDLQRQLDAYKNEVEEYRKEAETSSGYYKLLSEQLTKAEIMAGLVDVQGQGIVVTLNDSQKRTGDNITDLNVTLIHEDDLRRVVNELSAAGAEAIAINDSRIVSNSAIRCVGPVILVNDEKMAPPYTVKAIGKPDQLTAALNLNGGVIEMLRAFGFEVSIQQQSDIVIPKYNGTVTFQDAVPIEKEETAQ